jgi:hypothetical protein
MSVELGVKPFAPKIRNKTLEILETDSAMFELEIREFSALSIPNTMQDQTMHLGVAAISEFRENGCSFSAVEVVFATQQEISSVSSEFVRNLVVTIAIDEDESRQ